MADTIAQDPFVTHGIQVTAKWDWTTNVGTGRWSNPQQGIKAMRFHIPNDGNAPNDDGHSIRFSRLKIRGKGRSVSFRFDSESGKDFQILGWSVPFTAETNQ